MPETHCQTWDSFLDLCFLLSNGVKGWGFGVMNSKHSAPIFYFAIIFFSEIVIKLSNEMSTGKKLLKASR